MIEAPNFNFVHMPKTGGTWVRDIVGATKVSEKENEIPDFSRDVVHFGVIRNPWDWYWSWYRFVMTGSRLYEDHREHSFVIALGEDKSFANFILMLNCPTSRFKEKLFSHTSHTAGTDGIARVRSQIAAHWLNSDLSYYELMVKMYLHGCDRVIRLENISAELPTALDEYGLLTPEIARKVSDTSPANVGHDRVCEYDKEAIEIVASRNATTIAKHGYVRQL